MRHERVPLADRCRGRWRDILIQLGAADPRLLDGKHHACPWCGGRDRWRFTDLHGTGTFICNQCGRGTGTDIIMRSLGLDFKGAAERIESVLGETKPHLPAARSDGDNRAAMNVIWRQAHPIRAGDAADLYLNRRVGRGSGAWPSALRAADSLDYWRDGACGRYPALLAKVIAPDGTPCQLQRTYLTQQGEKAPVPEAKKLMKGALPKGAAVRLSRIVDDGLLGIAEGCETAMAAALLHDIPTWACLTAGNLAEFEPPSGVRKLVIFGDNDSSYTGQETAYRLARRLKIKGSIEVDVQIPWCAKDWADVLADDRGEARLG